MKRKSQLNIGSNLLNINKRQSVVNTGKRLSTKMMKMMITKVGGKSNKFIEA